MIAATILILIAALSVTILYYFYRDAKKRRVARSSRQRHPFRCVTVLFDEAACCEAIKALRGKRILCRSAPLVPLADCDRPVCECKYQHFDDRRQEDRREYYSRTARDYVGLEKRIRNGDRRRHSGSAAADQPYVIY